MTTQKTLRLLIAVKSEILRSGLKSLLADTEIAVAAEATTGPAAVEAARENDVQVVFLDSRLPDGDGLATLRRIKQNRPDLPILMLSNYANPTLIACAVAWGASGYLLKNCTRDDLIRAITTAAAGEYLFTSEELRSAKATLTASPRDPEIASVALTPGEREVLQQLAYGLTNRGIATELEISPATVEEQVQHIFRKIGVEERAQAAAWAVRQGVV